MTWSWFVALDSALLLAAGFFGSKLVRANKRRRVGEVVWYRDTIIKDEWQLAIIERTTEYRNVYWGRTLNEDRVCCNGWDLQSVYWWQRNKVDPLIAKYYLLKGVS